MEMLGQSGVLTILGLGIVFVFLIVLITVVTFVGKIFSRGLDSNTMSTNAGISAAANVDKARITAAISAAVTEYKKTN
jgi:oxaloacetate decarboxylase gamma subunit